jgi:transcriptional regulator with XRE-family HTH domain
MNYIKFFRFFEDKSQAALAKQTGLNQTRISRIEREIVPPNSLEKRLLARALNKNRKAIFPEEKS